MTKYLIYETYALRYIIDFGKIPSHIIDGLEESLVTWLEEHCYYVLLTSLIPNFMEKVNHNLIIARKQNDQQYLIYLREKFNIVIDPLKWEYQPPKIKLQIRKSKVDGWIMEPIMTQLLKPSDPTKIYKFRSEIIRLVHQYIHQHQLQHQMNRCIIQPNNQLQSILTPLTKEETAYTYYNLPDHLIGFKST